MTVYGYVRVSTDEQKKGTSPDEQERRVRELGATVIIDDPAVSGATPLLEREHGKRLNPDLLKKGDVVIAAKLDRMFRDATDALVMSGKFKKRGVSLVLADMGEEPVTGNGMGRMYFGLLSLFAEFERERIAERMNDGRRSKRAAGGSAGGKKPFGYRVVGEGKKARLVPIPEEQAAIKRIVAMHKSGMSQRRIAATLRSEGFQISFASVARILRTEGNRLAEERTKNGQLNCVRLEMSGTRAKGEGGRVAERGARISIEDKANTA